MDQYRRGELVFDVIDEGQADGPVIVLLHGFPQFNTTWEAVIPRLTAAGYRCLPRISAAFLRVRGRPVGATTAWKSSLRMCVR